MSSKKYLAARIRLIGKSGFEDNKNLVISAYSSPVDFDIVRQDARVYRENCIMNG